MVLSGCLNSRGYGSTDNHAGRNVFCSDPVEYTWKDSECHGCRIKSVRRWRFTICARGKRTLSIDGTGGVRRDPRPCTSGSNQPRPCPLHNGYQGPAFSLAHRKRYKGDILVKIPRRRQRCPYHVPQCIRCREITPKRLSIYVLTNNANGQKTNTRIEQPSF